MQKRLKATVAFYRDLEPDPDAAAVALRQAGYEVAMIPEKIPGINLMEVTKCIDEVKQLMEMMDDVETIVHPYEGMCKDRGEIVGSTSHSRARFGGVVEQGEQERIDVRVTPWVERPATPDEVEMVERLLQRKPRRDPKGSWNTLLINQKE